MHHRQEQKPNKYAIGETMAFRKLFFKRVQGIRDNYLLQEGDIALDEDDFQLYRGDGTTIGGVVIAGATSAVPVSTGNGTDVSITGGESTATGSTGGNTVITGGIGVATGGNVNINGGNGSTDGNINIGTENTTLITIGTSGNNIDFPATTTIDFTGATVTGLGVSGIANDIVNDTTPQLGGNLDLNNFDITGTGDINITGTVTASGGVTLAGTTDVDTITTDGLSISDNNISANRTNDDLTLSASGTGKVIIRGNAKFFDGSTSDNRLSFGDSDDLLIFHNGGHSIIREVGTGNLYLQSDNNVIIGMDTGSETMIKGIANGAVELYHNNVKKFDTGSHGVDIVDEAHIEGATPHLTLKRTDNANVPTIRFKGSGGTVGASIEFDGTSGTTNELVFKSFPDSTLTEMFRVTLTGANVVGDLQVGKSNTDATITTNGTGGLTINTNGGTNSGFIQIPDGNNANITVDTAGNGDILLKTDGSAGRLGIGTVGNPDTAVHIKSAASIITLQRTDDSKNPGLSFQNSNGNTRGAIKIDGTSGTSNEIFMETYDGSSQTERFRVQHTGVKVTGNLTLGSTTAVSGVLDEDNLASDSATALATQQSIKAYVDGRFTQTTTTVNTLATDGLTITDNNVSANRSNDDLILSASGTGNVFIDSNAKFNDNVKLLLGDSDDLQIWHNGSNSIIQNSTGELQLRGNTIRLLNAATDEDFAFFNDDGSVDLYHNNTKRFETTATGAKVSGSLQLGSTTAVSSVLDEDDFSSNSATALATQQSIKAYVDANAGGSGLQSRSTKTGTTGSLADAAQADLDITGFKAYALLTISTDRAARVRLYVSAATRTADASRVEGTDPTSDAGLIAEVITTGAQTVIISPGAYGFNLESSPTTTIPCRVTNKSGSTSTVQVTLNVLQLEA